jgi:uncharacterized protein (UPF0332 family)
MSPRDFLDQADELVNAAREVDWRSAASRAYYAAFHVARSLLEAAGFVVPRAEQAHQYLHLRLANSGHPDIEQAGTELDDLRRRRNRADYDLHIAFPQSAAHDAVTTALAVIDLLESLAAAPALLAPVVAGIRAYEQNVLRQVTFRGPPPP